MAGVVECHYVSSRLCVPQRDITICIQRRKASSIWRCCNNPTRIFAVSAIESIVNTSQISIIILLPALDNNVYFTQESRPLLPFSYHYLHRTPSHTLVHLIQHGIAWHGQSSRIIDILCTVREPISVLQEPSIPVVQQLCQLVVQLILCLYQ